MLSLTYSSNSNLFNFATLHCCLALLFFHVFIPSSNAATESTYVTDSADKKELLPSNQMMLSTTVNPFSSVVLDFSKLKIFGKDLYFQIVKPPKYGIVTKRLKNQMPFSLTSFSWSDTENGSIVYRNFVVINIKEWKDTFLFNVFYMNISILQNILYEIIVTKDKFISSGESDKHSTPDSAIPSLKESSKVKFLCIKLISCSKVDAALPQTTRTHEEITFKDSIQNFFLQYECFSQDYNCFDLKLLYNCETTANSTYRCLENNSTNTRHSKEVFTEMEVSFEYSCQGIQSDNKNSAFRKLCADIAAKVAPKNGIHLLDPQNFKEVASNSKMFAIVFTFTSVGLVMTAVIIVLIYRWFIYPCKHKSTDAVDTNKTAQSSKVSKSKPLEETYVNISDRQSSMKRGSVAKSKFSKYKTTNNANPSSPDQYNLSNINHNNNNNANKKERLFTSNGGERICRPDHSYKLLAPKIDTPVYPFNNLIPISIPNKGESKNGHSSPTDKSPKKFFKHFCSGKERNKKLVETINSYPVFDETNQFWV